MTKRQFELINDTQGIRDILDEQGLKCWIVIGTEDLVVVGKEDRRGHLQEIPVEEFIEILKRNNLALYVWPKNNYVKVMRAPRGKEINKDDDWEDSEWGW